MPDAAARRRALLDANVLFSFGRRTLLLNIAERRGFDPVWSDLIIKELVDNLDADLGMARERIAHLLVAMREAFPTASLTCRKSLIETMWSTVHDPDDAHVVAAAKQGGCDVIVTENGRDFNGAALAEHGMAAVTSDEFLTGLLLGGPRVAVYQGLVDMWSRMRQRPTFPQFLERLWDRDRLYGFIQALTGDVSRNVGIARDRIDERAVGTRMRQIEQGIGI